MPGRLSKEELRWIMILGGCVGLGVVMGNWIGEAIYRQDSDLWQAKLVGGLICIVVATVAYQAVKAFYRREPPA